jgi:cytochrome c-type biogenesis protein CcsB
MDNPLLIDVLLHWISVVFYAFSAIINFIGVIFRKDRIERGSYYITVVALIIHSIALIYRWILAGHGPYVTRHEVLSANAWVVILTFLLSVKWFPKIKPVSIVVMPSTFFLIALSLFHDTELSKLPPTFNSIWLVIHVIFIKLSLATLLIALGFSISYLIKIKRQTGWLERLPDIETIDIYAYRFAGFGFICWTNATLSGALWAYQSWGRFWGWDPIETWSLITWISFGIYLHMRRFFGWKGAKASYLFIFCFILSIISLFFVPVIQESIHSEYFT